MTHTGNTASDIITANASRMASDPDRNDTLTCDDHPYVMAILAYAHHVARFLPRTVTPGGLATDIADGIATGYKLAVAKLDAAMYVRCGRMFLDGATDDDRDELIMDIDVVTSYLP
jgi:hypothetical protein